jgi:hypothetical protein
MTYLLICRTCGSRAAAELAVNQRELAEVGMLERGCFRCGTDTRWGRLEDYRRAERRHTERRAGERRSRGLPRAAEPERRTGFERRKGPIRLADRRRG